MLNLARASPGMTLVAVFGTDTRSTAGSTARNGACPRRAASRPAGRSCAPAWARGLSACADRRRAPACPWTMSSPLSEPRRPILISSPRRPWGRRLADDAGVDRLAPRRSATPAPYGAVDRWPFLVAGDEQASEPPSLPSVRKVARRRRDEAGDGALHVDRAAAVEHAIADVGCERRHGPGTLVTRRHDVGMAGKTKVGRAEPMRA